MIATSHRVVAIDDLPWIITAEYDEQPDLRLTFHEVQTLWRLSTRKCQDVLDYLTDTGMLIHDEDDRYSRTGPCA